MCCRHSYHLHWFEATSIFSYDSMKCKSASQTSNHWSVRPLSVQLYVIQALVSRSFLECFSNHNIQEMKKGKLDSVNQCSNVIMWFCPNSYITFFFLESLLPVENMQKKINWCWRGPEQESPECITLPYWLFWAEETQSPKNSPLNASQNSDRRPGPGREQLPEITTESSYLYREWAWCGKLWGAGRAVCPNPSLCDCLCMA